MTINNSAPATDAARRERSGRASRFYNIRLSERDAWFGATAAALFTAVGMLLEVAIVRKNPGISAKPAEVSAFVALLLLIFLFIRRKTPSVRWASVVYLINTASVLTVLVSTNLNFAVAERNWLPFDSPKLGCLIAPMVAPGCWVGLVSILAYFFSAFLQFEIFFPREIRSQVADAEPWPLLAFALAGILALVYRFRRAQLEQEIAHVEAQSFAIKRLATAFLNIRDLMNTPLQVIELSIEVLCKSNHANKPIIDHIDHSMQRLREINSVLVQHEKEIEWEAKR